MTRHKMMTVEEFKEQAEKLRRMAEESRSPEEMREIISRIAQLSRKFRIQSGIGLPLTPIEQALEHDPHYRDRPHLRYLSDRVAEAVRGVERGQNRMLTISLPPRAGKTTLMSQHMPLWLMRRHPEWKIGLVSYDGSLTTTWARNLRNVIENNPGYGVAIKPDNGAGGEWQTTEGGGMFATSVRGTFIGRGVKVLIIDDPVKDFIEAHSIASRNNLWNWWLSVANTRLEGPYLVIVVMTRWHEDDFIGRIYDDEYEGDSKSWEPIVIPALADSINDPLGRSEGQPLYSPFIEELEGDAVRRWEQVRASVGNYTFAAMYQQRPAPQKGAIFDAGWWRFWTIDPNKATDDGRVVYLNMPTEAPKGKWVDSWDCNFESNPTQAGGWVVGQRWMRSGANRYLISQVRGKWTFTQTLQKMLAWADHSSPFGSFVHERLIEKRANGAAIIDVLKEKVSGIKPINPTTSKEARARAITPEMESGNVLIPHPGDPGNEWVSEYLMEMRNFPQHNSDDQVDATTQALAFLRGGGKGRVTDPNSVGAGRTGRGLTEQRWLRNQDVARAALNDLYRR